MKIILILMSFFLSLALYADVITLEPIGKRTTTAGTASPLCPSSTLVVSVIATCLSTNANPCYITNSTAKYSTQTGVQVAVGGSYEIKAEIVGKVQDFFDCNTAYFDISTTGEGVFVDTLRK